VPTEHVNADACPICDSAVAAEFLHQTGVPVHQNLLCPTPQSARDLARGTLALRACPGCGFISNTAFDAALLGYGEHYDNSQNHSPAFAAYVDGLVRDLVERHGVRNSRIIEVGCGKGAFLRKLLSYPETDNEGVGYDPTYLGPETDVGGRARFVRTFFGPATAQPADVVICRHVIEHVPRPLELLAAVRSGLAGGRPAKVFFETPCADWILDNRVVWDFFYEHCSLFTRQALGRALARAGFDVGAIRQVFGGQYLWAEAQAGAGSFDAEPVRRVAERAAAFARHRRLSLALWAAVLHDARRLGPVVVWGAGAKGATFCHLADPQAILIDGVVDINPAKAGKYLPGTGHPILAPEEAAARGAATVLVLNPNYVAEVGDRLARLGTRAAVLDLSRWQEAEAA
jgi:SAM-dependent methyltransferase